MIPKSVQLVCFSPTGTTKTVVEGIARGLLASCVEIIDITLPEARKKHQETREDDLLILGVPVYMGRVPALIVDWLRAMKVRKTPTVCVVVYGNRVYEDALLELTDIAKACGGIPVAGGAFIGEHSFSCDETPTAAGRPDNEDILLAEEFGRKIRDLLARVPSADQLPEVQVPGMNPYRGDPALWTVDFIAVNDRCSHCGTCARVCPVGAVDPDNCAVINQEKCITCCACIRRCPGHARTMKPGPVKDASIRLCTLYSEHKEPETFLP